MIHKGVDAGADRWPEYNIYSEGSCSSCQALLSFTMEKLKALGEYDKNAGASIVVGRKKELPKGISPEDLILVGDCLKKYRGQGAFAGGCPPGEPFPLWAIIDRKDYSEVSDGARDRMARETDAFMEYAEKKRAAAKAGAKEKKA